MLKTLLATSLVLAVFGSCSGGISKFAGKDGGLRGADSKPNTTPGEEGLPDDPNQEKETFSYGGKVDLTDFLFVVDNSCSMKPFINKVIQGFEALAAEDYPANAHMAVMTTMPANFSDFSKVHADVNDYPGIEKEPGFLAPVNAAAVAGFKSAGTQYSAAAYPNPVCDDAWFPPKAQTSKTGVSCLAAALQRVGHCVGAEAGLTASRQLFLKNGSKPVFRDGAYAHIVILSDSHDPGRGSAVLAAARPTFAQIRDAALSNSKISGLKMHGVVVKSDCGEGNGSQSYVKAIEEAAGVSVDLCTETDYKPVAKQIVTSSTPSAVFVLKKEVDEITSVLVNGKAVSTYTVEKGNVVTIQGLDEHVPTKIEITYTAK